MTDDLFDPDSFFMHIPLASVVNCIHCLVPKSMLFHLMDYTRDPSVNSDDDPAPSLCKFIVSFLDLSIDPSVHPDDDPPICGLQN